MTPARLVLPVSFASLCIFALALPACSGDDTTAETGDETSTAGDGDGDPTGDGDGDPTGDGDGDPTGDGDGDPTGGGVCGDGNLDEGEECDDGNTDEGDGCSASCTVTACGLRWSWTEDVDSSAAGGFDATVSIDGSVYVAGISINADNDAWVAKWNPDGSQAWSKSFDSGNGNDAAAAIAFDAGSGTIFATGWFEGSGDDRWIIALDGDGNEIWSEVYDHGAVMGGDDRGTGITVADGSVFIASRVRVGDGDDDVLVTKLDASTGDELWTATWSGTGDGMFSTDRSGPIAVAADGTVWVGAREHVDFDSQDATLLHFDADGNFVAAYQPQGGGDQQQDPIDVVTDGDAVYFAFEKGGFPYRAWLYKLAAADGSEQWVKTEADWVVEGSDWAIRGIGVDGSGNLGVAGVFTNEEEGEGISWGEAWTAKLDDAGELVCRSSHQVLDGNVIPPSLSIDGAGYGAGGFGLTGIETAGQGNATKLWTGYFLGE